MLALNHKQRISVLLLSMSIITSIGVFWAFFRLFGGIVNYNLMSISTMYFTFSLVVDSVSLTFSCIVLYISGCVFIFSRWYMNQDVYYYRFSLILLLFVVSMNILIYSGSMFVMLLGWDGLGVSSFALIIYYQSVESSSAGFLTLLINRLGDVMIMSVMFYYVMMGSSLLLNYSNEWASTMLIFLAVAAMTKSAQYPFSAWLPAAMAAPTPVSALVHSSTLVTAGIYIMIRACMTIELTPTILSLFLFCGSITSLLGGMCAFYENDIKKVVAFSTLSQLGFMVFSLGLGSHMLALLHLYTHAMFKALLFLVAGCTLLLTFGVQDMRLLGASLKNSPILLSMLNISSLCLMGVPFLSAFYSKHMIISLMAMHHSNVFATCVMLIAITLSSAYMVRMLKILNWSTKAYPVENNLHMPISFYTPLFMLFLGSLLLGWLFNLIDNSYVLVFILPSTIDLGVLSIMIVGVFMGLFINKTTSPQFLSSIFYSTPFWLNFNYVTYKLTTEYKTLEVGWVEPYSYLSTMNNTMTKITFWSLWPNNGLGFARNFTLSLMLSILLWYYLKS